MFPFLTPKRLQRKKRLTGVRRKGKGLTPKLWPRRAPKKGAPIQMEKILED